MKRIIPIALAFFLSAAPAYATSLIIQGVSPGPAVDVGTYVSFFASAQGFYNPQFALVDTTPKTGGTSGKIDVAGNFSWVPTIYDAGWHTFLVTATDATGNVASSTVSILVRNNSILISAFAPTTTVRVGQTVTATILAPGYVNPTFAIYDLSFGTTISSSMISGTGAFSWTPTTADLGSHAITFTASDLYGHSGQVTQSVTVISANAPTTTPAINAPAPAATPASAPAVQAAPPSSAASFTFATGLGLRSRGRGVTELQNRLFALGLLSSEPTGYFGLGTYAAVKKYQKANGLPETGFVGPATRKVLNSK